jgi:hypothetical protein
VDRTGCDNTIYASVLVFGPGENVSICAVSLSLGSDCTNAFPRSVLEPSDFSDGLRVATGCFEFVMALRK